MRTYPECIPCQVSFALTTAKKATESEELVGELVLEALGIVLAHGLDHPPPLVAREIGRRVRERTGVEDPYKEDKRRHNRLALELYPQLKERVRGAPDPLREALLLAAGGNVIDSIAMGEVDPSEVIPSLFGGEFALDHYGALRDLLPRARRLLLIGDNAGEIVMDRILVEELLRLYPHLQVSYAVRGGPIINDATMEDALEVGMDRLCRLVSTGDDTPGVILDLCSEAFVGDFTEADLVIAKGQGNFETLEGRGDPRVFFLLRAKCPTIGRHLEVEGGALVLFTQG